MLVFVCVYMRTYTHMHIYIQTFTYTTCWLNSRTAGPTTLSLSKLDRPSVQHAKRDRITGVREYRQCQHDSPSNLAESRYPLAHIQILPYYSTLVQTNISLLHVSLLQSFSIKIHTGLGSTGGLSYEGPPLKNANGAAADSSIILVFVGTWKSDVDSGKGIHAIQSYSLIHVL